MSNLNSTLAQRAKVVIGLFVLQVVASIAIMNTPITQSQASSLNSTFGTLTSPIYSNPTLLGKATLIFSHNLLIAGIEFIPGIGWALFALSTYETARVVQAIALTSSSSASHINAQVLFLSLFILPHSWLELPAYAIAIMESFYLVYAIRSHSVTSEVNRAILVFIFVAVELFVAAIFEAAELIMPVYALAYWLPALLVFFLAAVAIKRINAHNVAANTAV
ncbi:MAG: stage II sporulation protein M [Conexivisphaerales archaeon]